ncbi:MAG: restriction endonuclease subunit M, partial [Clostridia bacterium]|nr:restriction endonuclease subunit M [Clostridia bacterium]
MVNDMAQEIRVDIKENRILALDSTLLNILLKDNSSGKNIIWATDDYTQYDETYTKDRQITVFSVTGKNGTIIKPRTEKTKQEQLTRVRDKAEVFTPSWICNKQNNLVDNAWFGREGVFNVEQEKTWTATQEKITFPDGKTWQDYVKANRLEISCGEAPYLASRYDAVSGNTIPVKERIGLLDRKLRIVSENVDDEQEWYEWAKQAVKSVYGYEWQGDNVLLARENLLFTFSDYYEDKFNKKPSKVWLREIAEILSWNIWQMDGLKFVIPNSCHNSTVVNYTLFGEETHEEVCEGCKKNNPKNHNGIYCYVMDWETNKKVKFVSLIKK